MVRGAYLAAQLPNDSAAAGSDPEVRELFGYGFTWEFRSDYDSGFRMLIGYSFNHYQTLKRFSFPDTGIFRFTMTL